MATEERFWPDVAIAPGQFLAENLAAMGISQAELARRTGRPVQAINEIVQGKKEITPETALQLERALGMPAHVWVGLEMDYKLVQARLADTERLKEEVPLAREYPYAEMAKHGWVPAVRDAVERVRELLLFFGVASLQHVPDPLQATTFRKSQKVSVSRAALAAWLRQGERLAAKMTTGPFNPKGLREMLPALRALVSKPIDEAAPALQQILADHGVAVVFVPHLPKTGANGATRWVGDRPITQLSIRGSYADIFWFTVFHEILHVLKHGRRELFIKFEDSGATTEELEADTFAREVLIPASAYERLAGRPGHLSETAVRSFAMSIGVPPGIVVGRLHYEDRVPRTHLRVLLDKIQWAGHEGEGES